MTPNASYLLPDPPWTYLQIGIMAAIWLLLLIGFLAVLFPAQARSAWQSLWRPVRIRVQLHPERLNDPSEADLTAFFKARETACDPIRPAAPRFMREHQNTGISLVAKRGER